MYDSPKSAACECVVPGAIHAESTLGHPRQESRVDQLHPSVDVRDNLPLVATAWLPPLVQREIAKAHIGMHVRYPMHQKDTVDGVIKYLGQSEQRRDRPVQPKRVAIDHEE